MLLFSDVRANTIYKWTEAKGKEVYLKPAGYTGAEPRGGFMGPNGLYFSNDGQMLICQHGDRRIARMNAPVDAPQPTFVIVAGEYMVANSDNRNDGIKIDKKSNVFAAGTGGIWIFTKDCKLIGEIKVNGVAAPNYALTPAGKIIFITDQTIYLELRSGKLIFDHTK